MRINSHTWMSLTSSTSKDASHNDPCSNVNFTIFSPGQQEVQSPAAQKSLLTCRQFYTIEMKKDNGETRNFKTWVTIKNQNA